MKGTDLFMHLEEFQVENMFLGPGEGNVRRLVWLGYSDKRKAVEEMRSKIKCIRMDMN